jgi:hypothetical protein
MYVSRRTNDGTLEKDKLNYTTPNSRVKIDRPDHIPPIMLVINLLKVMNRVAAIYACTNQEAKGCMLNQWLHPV